MTDLFNIPETLSPRLQWLKKRDVRTCKSTCLPDGEEPWNAWSGDLTEAVSSDKTVTGNTEDEAIANLAKRNGWLLWNEEGATKCL